MSFSRTKLLCFATMPDGYSFEERVAAAARSGFEEMSFWLMSLDEARQELGSWEAVKAVLDEQGIRASSLEFLTAWARPDGDGYMEELHVMLAAAEIFAPDVVMTGCMETTLVDESAAVSRLREQCVAARDYKFNFALEFLPWTAIPDIPTAIRIVEAVNEDNLGYVFDTWHFARAGADYDALAGMPGEKIHLIQTSDLRAQPDDDLLTETMGYRVAPGEGVLDWPRIRSIWRESGVDCVIGTEQFSNAIKAMPLQEASDYLYKTTQQAVTD
jgi:sugar phosphate isomerase/epimerase